VETKLKNSTKHRKAVKKTARAKEKELGQVFDVTITKL
jgi:hypothetical protein